MPLLGEMTERTYRDLADAGRTVFAQVQVEDFIRAGIVEINRVAAVERYDDITLVDQTTEYIVDIVQPYRVAVRDSIGNDIGTVPMVQPVHDDEWRGQFGYRFRRSGEGGVIELPLSLVNTWMAVEDVDRARVRVYGYGNRVIPYMTQEHEDPEDPGSPLVDVDPETGLSHDEEYAVREYAKAEGFTLLTHDRSLFAQWQGQTNNTDVSPVMMMNMASMARQEWSRRRGLIRTIRHQW